MAVFPAGLQPQVQEGSVPSAGPQLQVQQDLSRKNVKRYATYT